MFLLLLGCQGTVLVGKVHAIDGGPVAGATLTSPGCVAVTDHDGRFRVGCEAGTRSFVVTHPEHLDRTWLVSAEGYGETDVGTAELARIPTGGGIWLAGDGAITPLPQAPLVRTSAKDDQRWCFDGTQGDPVAVGTHVRLLDNHVVDWRLYKVDADGCPWRMTRSGAEHWTFTAERVPVEAITKYAEGRNWVDLDLEAGDYAIVEWYEGFLVPEESGQYRSHWLRVSGLPAKPAIVPEPVLDGPDEVRKAE